MYLRNVYVKFIRQGHRVKVKVTVEKPCLYVLAGSLPSIKMQFCSIYYYFQILVYIAWRLSSFMILNCASPASPVAVYSCARAGAVGSSSCHAIRPPYLHCTRTLFIQLRRPMYCVRNAYFPQCCGFSRLTALSLAEYSTLQPRVKYTTCAQRKFTKLRWAVSARAFVLMIIIVCHFRPIAGRIAIGLPGVRLQRVVSAPSRVCSTTAALNCTWHCRKCSLIWQSRLDRQRPRSWSNVCDLSC